MPRNSRKKGADGGIGVKDVRELLISSSIARSEDRVFISLEPHTQSMVKEAAGAGLYEGPTGKIPKIQLFTIKELLGGSVREFHWWSEPSG